MCPSLLKEVAMAEGLLVDRERQKRGAVPPDRELAAPMSKGAYRLVLATERIDRRAPAES